MNIDLRKEIKHAQERWGVKDSQLAAWAKLDRTLVWRYLHDKCDMTGEKIAALMEALNLRVAPVMSYGRYTRRVPPWRLHDAAAWKTERRAEREKKRKTKIINGKVVLIKHDHFAD